MAPSVERTLLPSGARTATLDMSGRPLRARQLAERTSGVGAGCGQSGEFRTGERRSRPGGGDCYGLQVDPSAEAPGGVVQGLQSVQSPGVEGAEESGPRVQGGVVGRDIAEERQLLFPVGWSGGRRRNRDLQEPGGVRMSELGVVMGRP